MDPRTPCIVGVAQKTYREADGDAPEPLAIWAAMAREAARDSGGNAVLDAVDSLQVVFPMAWQYDDPPARLAELLGLKDGDRYYSGVSGTTPQRMVNDCAREIFEGRRDMALIVSAEVLATQKRMKKRGSSAGWSFPMEGSPGSRYVSELHPSEAAHHVFQAYSSFAVFDVARRAHLGLSPQENRQRDGELLARMTGVAANNPRAWFPIAQTASELIEVTPRNRMISDPYAKNMVAIMDVDMGAALLLTSHGKADALGVPKDRRVTLRAFCSANDPTWIAARHELWRSRAMEEASREALRCAGTDLDAIAQLDLYSCFASSVNFARDALGIGDDDTRQLTVTGGLPYFGGPGNGYVTHSIATLVERLRERPDELGLVSGIGMHMEKHTYGIYSATPGVFELPDEAAVQARVDAGGVREIETHPSGPAEVSAYSVVWNREGPEYALVVCELPNGSRCYANAVDLELLAAMQREEWVGRSVELRPGEDPRTGAVNLLTAG
ncbi:MAG: acetyl-CoA synthetase [Myxococcota bacterium]|jgi:acetyl-CoA C-acetyltransferase|nr:acetyl-CoA synthetase [Myxococcota bacterium]